MTTRPSFRDYGSFFPSPISGNESQQWLWDPTGLVPISIGAQAIDPITGEHGPVIGVQMDPSARVVVPVVQVLEALPRGAGDPELVCSRGLFNAFPHSAFTC